ncbi:MAG: hypothetical protein HZB26_12525 [Candidatus Hydrogenedentes bacterium]|nr:hypothetical protein [Candidatus Hydrogenedentota bacterium]
MGHEPTPSPEPERYPSLGCVVVSVAVTAILIGIAVVTKAIPAIIAAASVTILAGVAIIMAIADGIRARLDLVKARSLWRPMGIQGVLVYSNSPHWKEYVETNWLPSLRDRFVLLNWSEKQQWPQSLEVRLFRRYCGGRKYFDENYNPAIILLRETRHPLVFKFFYAFRDAKHGNLAALENLERTLFRELGLEYEGCRYAPHRYCSRMPEPVQRNPLQ